MMEGSTLPACLFSPESTLSLPPISPSKLQGRSADFQPDPGQEALRRDNRALTDL